jgi:molybdopterin-guanine dinucleotide biosynthesis protein A
MALRVADILEPSCSRVVIEARAGSGYEVLGLPLVHAALGHEGKGPLAGIAAGLSLAERGERVAFAPCDMPLLNRGIHQVLNAEGGQGAYVQIEKGVEPLVAVLSASARTTLLDHLAGDVIVRTHVALDAAGAVRVAFNNVRLFANVNAPDDLARVVKELRWRRELFELEDEIGEVGRALSDTLASVLPLRDVEFLRSFFAANEYGVAMDDLAHIRNEVVLTADATERIDRIAQLMARVAKHYERRDDTPGA